MKKLLLDHLAIWLAIIAIIIITCFAFMPAYYGSTINSINAGQFGDFIGGYFGTVILIFSVAAFMVSYRNQRTTNERAAFENRYFELLNVHRENLAEIALNDRTGRRAFVSMIREFREVLQLVQKESIQLPNSKQAGDLLDFAYLVFYYGVGHNSTRILRSALSHDYNVDLVDRVIAKLESIQTDHYSLSARLQDPTVDDQGRVEIQFKLKTLTRLSYCPFDGHQSRLAHYYRHLFHTVRYAESHAPNGSADEYVDILRAQLSNHEQALFCLNALSTLGSAWIQRGFMDRFQLIRNLPKNFFNPSTEFDVEKRFPNIVFEYSKGNETRETNADVFDYERRKEL